MKILLIGANGQLGTDLCRVLAERGDDVVALTYPEFDIRNGEQVRCALDSAAPEVVINTSAYHKVEECEEHPDIAFDVNALAVRAISLECERRGCVLVHFSTDYVFDGRKGSAYSECDRPEPLNVYGVSKLAGEHLIAFNTERYFIVRTSGLYGLAGAAGKGGNFVENMLKRAVSGGVLRVVHDQVLTPTYTVDLARKVSELIRTDAYGMYHITNEGACSWYEFTVKILELEAVNVTVLPVETKDFPSPVKRPAYSVLLKDRLHSAGLGTTPIWTDALGRYLRSRLRC